jgi:hypothetical protein
MPPRAAYDVRSTTSAIRGHRDRQCEADVTGPANSRRDRRRDGFRSIAARGELQPDVHRSRAGDPAGRLGRMGSAGRRTRRGSDRLPVGDLGPDRRILDRAVVDVDGGCDHALSDVDEGHRFPVRGGGQPGHRRRGRLRDRLCDDGATADDRCQPRSADDVSRPTCWARTRRRSWPPRRSTARCGPRTLRRCTTTRPVRLPRQPSRPSRRRPRRPIRVGSPAGPARSPKRPAPRPVPRPSRHRCG